MAKKKLAEKKIKARERKVKEVKSKKRLFEARRVRYERELEKEVKLNQDKLTPIRRDTHEQKILENLEKNYQILKALEQDYLAAQKEKANLQAELEAEGYESLDQKMKALEKKAFENAQELQEKIIEAERLKHESSIETLKEELKETKKSKK